MSSASRRKSIPARSHFTRRSETGSNTFETVSSSEVRQQTLSFTYKELNILEQRRKKLETLDDELFVPIEPMEQPKVSQLGNLQVESPTIPHVEYTVFEDHMSETSPLLYTSPTQKSFGMQFISCLPAVFLATTLNVLDAISYGIIIFPTDPIFPSSAASSGISMFFCSTVLSQLLFTFGASKFRGSVGSMMIEVIPFLHLISNQIISAMPNSSHHSILATIMVAYASSTLLTGIVFLLLGLFKLGNMIQFFPRHTLIGCIGGIGLFLCLTGIEVTCHLSPSLDLNYLTLIFQPFNLKLWGTSLLLAILLKSVQQVYDHAFLVPAFYVIVPLIFYVIVLSMGLSMDHLREYGWLFKIPDSTEAPFWTFWTYFDLFGINWMAVLTTLPTQLALAFFGILHVPINVPALSVSTRQDVDLSWELIGHGITNLVSGVFGATQNYLVYSNSLLYIRSGGDSTLAGGLLSVATLLVWVQGLSIIGYVPSIVVGSLIFHLGIDLLKESIVDTWHVTQRLEYLTILFIVFIMAFVGFTEGILVGIILSCIFFVFVYSQRRVIRNIFSGKQLRSTVHRLYRQQKFLDKVGDQIQVIRLNGFIFFGTVHQLNEQVASILNGETRYIILDFAMIAGIDYSATETFLRIRRMVSDKHIHLVFSNLDHVHEKVVNSGLFDLEDEFDENLYVHRFKHLNDALEWCENELLEAYYTRVSKNLLVPPKATALSHTPRKQQLLFAASEIAREFPHEQHPLLEPAQILLEAFPSLSPSDIRTLNFIAEHFERLNLLEGHVLFRDGDASDALYLVSEGELIVTIENNHIVETCLVGTMVGELEMLSGHPRTSTLVCQTNAVVWRLTKATFDRLSESHPVQVLSFTKKAVTFDSVRFYNCVHHWSQLRE